MIQDRKPQNCIECVMPDAVVYDELIGTPTGQREYKANADVHALAQKGA